MGRVAGAYGVRGWIRVQAPESGLAQCRTWWIGGTEYPVEQTKPHSGALLAKLAGLGSPEAARRLKGSKVLVRRGSLPEAGEGHYYLADLVGLAVVNGEGVVLGAVKRWVFNGAQDVMEVAGEKTRLIPWTAEVVREVDLAKRQIRIEWGADW
ncbi:MAG: ribosome maturation factor RimM [Burkholderiales bacterium]|jgi:16S rRNA processing protein RimM|nr:ribosome maturation factor RimM [Burkholderiales bacterium]